MPLVKQELLTLLEHLSSSQVFSGVRVTWSLFLYVCFVDRCLSFCTFSFGHCVVCSSSIYGFWFPLWYLLAIVLSVLLRYTVSDFPLVSFGHCVVCSSSIYVSDFPFGIFWPLCCLFSLDIRFLISPLVSSYSSNTLM